ncbi:unnamed protein product [Bemisia tabaci]|uniref:DDHD domain-containing protein n=1 Tax=Bemisia tabaci TaxID=7038 RepID=A0A9P0F3R3_BEMTA|nr:unnamed protein product [Bemisia tabaci]
MADKSKSDAFKPPTLPSSKANPLLKAVGNDFSTLPASSLLCPVAETNISTTQGSTASSSNPLFSGASSPGETDPHRSFSVQSQLPLNPHLPPPPTSRRNPEPSDAPTYSVPLTSSSPGPPRYPPSNLYNPASFTGLSQGPTVFQSASSADDDLSGYFNNLKLASNLTASKSVPSAVSNAQSFAPHPTSALPTSASFPAAPPTAPPPRGPASGNNYRLGNLHRTAYAQVPGLATVANPHITAPLQNPIPQQPMPVAQTPVMMDTSQYSVPPHSTPSPPASTSIMSPDAVDGGVASTLSSGFDSSYASGFNSSSNNPTYRPVYHHWFFKREIEGKVVWYPLSMADSTALEAALCSSELNVDTKVPTDGGRYDVEILRRQRVAVFWKEEPTEVRRCSWFSKGPTESRQMPYEENIATLLEEEYKQAVLTNSWSRRITLPNEDEIVIHSPTAIVHHSKNISFSNLATWDSNTPVQLQPKIVKRGLDEFNIAEGEPEKVDHLLFLVHGIGSFCDLKFRPVIEVVDDFRNISLQLTQSHFRGAIEQGIVNRIEVLPVSWHDVLHSQETGIDRKLQSITLQSIPKLRHFTNDTLLDILFYTSPIYCETIVQAVGNELNRLYSLYCSRNPHFRGGVSVGGHSLGSLILFDMLCNQLSVGHPLSSTETSEEHKNGHDSRKVGLGCLNSKDAVLSNDVSYVTIGRAGTGQPYIKYPQLSFQPAHFFGFGAPIGMFITIRGIASLGADFKFPTCPSFFNIFHPYDPVAYRIEPLIIPEMEKRHPVLIPHHKGRKRMHLQLRDTMAHVGAALKSTLMDSVRPVLNTVYQLAGYRGRPDEAAIEEQMTKALQEELTQEQEPSCAMHYDDDHLDESVRVGQLNGGRRIDYVLQEAPLESFNEYLFALSSHVCYWESEDTMLLVLKEIYSHMGVCVDNQIPQQMLPFDIPMSEAQSYSEGVPRYVSTMGPVSES